MGAEKLQESKRCKIKLNGDRVIMKKISVMIPCYNEEENARPIYEAVRDELLRSCPNYDYEILFIDNKSQDRTREIIREICIRNSQEGIRTDERTASQQNRFGKRLRPSPADL